MGTLRIIPLLIAFTIASFAAHLAEVVFDMRTMLSRAYAETPAPAPASAPPSPAAPAPAPNPEEKKEGDPKPAAPAAPASAPAPAEKAPPGPEWRAAGDLDPRYPEIRNELFEDLAKRRVVLEEREKALTTREAVLKATGQELNRKYEELSRLRGEIEKLLVQQSEEEKARIASLVKVYEGMKPKDAARIFDTLDLDVLVSVMSKMSERKISPVLASMDPERARTVTIILAEQKKLPTLP